MTNSLEQLAATLKEQHGHIKATMDTVASEDGPHRQQAFAELCRYLAAHEAAEVECIHPHAKGGLHGDTTVVDQRVAEEGGFADAIVELEVLGMESPAFTARFEKFREAFIAHADAEEREELPHLNALYELELAWVEEVLSRVPNFATSGDENVLSFKQHFDAAREEFRSCAPSAR